MVRCRCRVMLVTMLPSYAGDDATEATWPWYDVDAELCWRRCYRVILAMVLLSHVGNDTAEATRPRCDVDVESC
jgi:hypothetical protein